MPDRACLGQTLKRNKHRLLCQNTLSFLRIHEAFKRLNPIPDGMLKTFRHCAHLPLVLFPQTHDEIRAPFVAMVNIAVCTAAAGWLEQHREETIRRAFANFISTSLL